PVRLRPRVAHVRPVPERRPHVPARGRRGEQRRDRGAERRRHQHGRLGDRGTRRCGRRREPRHAAHRRRPRLVLPRRSPPGGLLVPRELVRPVHLRDRHRRADPAFAGPDLDPHLADRLGGPLGLVHYPRGVPEALPIFEIGIVLLAAALAGMASRRIGLPAVLGYLVVGLAVGPFTPGYVADRHQIQVLADVGVVLLLFEVGIELDLRALARDPRGILVAVPLPLAALPWLLRRTREQPDILFILAVSVALANAGLGGVVFGVPLALAAFVAGLLLSMRPEAQEARREVLPFRDLFAVLFFVAVGTLVDPAAVAREPGVLVLLLVLVALKAPIVT